MNNNIINDNEFKNIVNEIENEINNTQIEIFQGANKALLKLYYNVGKIINENFKWGNKFVDELARELKITYPNIKGFSARNLNSMKNIMIMKFCRRRLQKYLGHIIYLF